MKNPLLTFIFCLLFSLSSIAQVEEPVPNDSPYEIPANPVVEEPAFQKFDNQNETFYERDTDLGLTTVFQITNIVIEKESCPNEQDGSFYAKIIGGNITCGEYTYEWRDSYEYYQKETTTGELTIANIAAGKYKLFIKDCTNNELIKNIEIERKKRDRTGGGGCN